MTVQLDADPGCTRQPSHPSSHTDRGIAEYGGRFRVNPLTSGGYGPSADLGRERGALGCALRVTARRVEPEACSVPAIRRRDRQRKYRDTFFVQFLGFGPGRDTANASLRRVLIMDLSRFRGKARADILAVRKYEIDDPRYVNSLGLDGFDCAGRLS
jgi:hypothetical protein